MGFFKNLFNKTESEPPSNKDGRDFSSFNNFGQIGDIFSYHRYSNIPLTVQSAVAVHRIIENRKSDAINNRTIYHSLRYIELTDRDLSHFEQFDIEIRNSLFCVASMNKNGFIREKALRYILEKPSKITFPFILFRLSDWVPSIREITKSGIKKVLSNQAPRFLIENHKLINWLLTVERADLKTSYDEITDFIFTKENINPIVSVVETYSESERYFIFKNLIYRDLLDKSTIEKILVDKNYLIRLLAIRYADLKTNTDLHKKLLRDKSLKVRHYALNKITQDCFNLFEEEVFQMIFDDSTPIRRIARNIISKIGEVDFRRFYRDRVKTTPTKGAIIGLSEVGIKDDIITIIEFLNSDLAKIKTGALYALSNLDYNLAREQSFKLITDASISVKKASITVIETAKAYDDVRRLRSIYDESDIETKRFALKLLAKYGGWSLAGDIIKGIFSKDTNIQGMSYSLLNGWHNYSMRLGTDLTDFDIDYVMEQYNQLKERTTELPFGTQRIIKEIPFIFSRR